MFGQKHRTISDNPDDSTSAVLREKMVRTQIESRGIHDPVVLEACRMVPRHIFLPESQRQHAYEDRAVNIACGQTISQPYIVALMTESLRIDPESRVLEVGTGSGYQTAILAYITPHVYTVEVIPELLESAKQAWVNIGFANTIVSKPGNGYEGWPEYAPFDAIIVTCAPDHIPDALIEQLAPGGRMCIPVGKDRESQNLQLITKNLQGGIISQKLIPVRFVPMIHSGNQEDTV